MQKQQGFTLIELVMVIVILGILAATALPKFANLQKDARISTMEGAEAALKSAISMVHAKALIDGISNGNQTLTVEGMGDIAMVNQYPRRSAANFGLMLDLSTDFTLGNGTITHSGAATPNQCRITVGNATIANGQVVPPVITTVTTGC